MPTVSSGMISSASPLKSGGWAVSLLALATFAGTTLADETKTEIRPAPRPLLAARTEARLFFHEVSLREEKGGGKILEVFIRVKNTSDSTVDWPATSTSNVEAELLDGEGKPAADGPGGYNLSAGYEKIHLPYGSSIDWLVSHNHISLAKEQDHAYTLCVGNRAWLVPFADVSRYTLHLKIIDGDNIRRMSEKDLLIDVPPAKIEITPR